MWAMRAVFSAVTALVMSASLVRADVAVMPRELVEFAERHACAQVTDFFDRPGMVKPPYVYGYLPGAREDSAVFWCERKREGVRSFVLMIMVKEKAQGLLKCPAQIEWRNPPRGLDLYKNSRESLADFVSLSQPHRRGPSRVHLTQSAIRSEYDGVEEVFYCHSGEWLVRQRH